MNLEYLRTFLEVVRRGNLSEAARALDLSQPAVTYQMQRLERDLAYRLLERREGRLAVTPAGERLRQFAERVVAEEGRLRAGLSDLQEEVRGSLVVAASTVPGEFLLPRLLGEFTARYPGVTASVAIADTGVVARQVLARECDVGFVGARVSEPEIHSEPFARDEILLLAPPGHPWAIAATVRPQELAGERFLTRESGSGTMRSVVELLEGAGTALPELQAGSSFGSTQALLSAVEAGLGVAFISRCAAERSLRLGLVCAVPLEGLVLRRDLYLVYVEGRPQTRLLQEFVSFARSWGGGVGEAARPVGAPRGSEGATTAAPVLLQEP